MWEEMLREVNPHLIPTTLIITHPEDLDISANLDLCEFIQRISKRFSNNIFVIHHDK